MGARTIAGVRVLIIAVGKARSPYADDVAHYAKHLQPRAQVEQVEVRDTAAAIKRIPARAATVVLDPRGKVYDSPGFAKFIEQRQLDARPLCFVIGGADGIDLPDADHMISFGPMTLPHQLARVVLLEQLFRAYTIIAGEPYHRE